MNLNKEIVYRAFKLMYAKYPEVNVIENMRITVYLGEGDDLHRCAHLLGNYISVANGEHMREFLKRRIITSLSFDFENGIIVARFSNSDKQTHLNEERYLYGKLFLSFDEFLSEFLKCLGNPILPI